MQSTVSGSGNLQPATQLNLGFKTSGTVTHIYVSQGEHVDRGTAARGTRPLKRRSDLEQAKAACSPPSATLAKEEETEGEGSSTPTG